MYTSFYGMNCNPFLKDESIKYPFLSQDYQELLNRFKYLSEVKGIGLFTGSIGSGKTYTVRNFINNLNIDLYKVIYITVNKDICLFDFYQMIAENLQLKIGNCYKVDIYNKIQNEIKRIITKDKMHLIIVIDDANNLPKDILLNLKVLYDFEMDSKDYISLILIGDKTIKDELAKEIHEALKQRIIINYTLEGLNRSEVKDYVKSRLKCSGAYEEIFSEESINALYACSEGIPRKLNNLINNSLMIGFSKKREKIDLDIIMDAKKEMEMK